MIFFGIPLNWLPWPLIFAFVEYPYGSLHELDWKQGPASKFTFFSYLSSEITLLFHDIFYIICSVSSFWAFYLNKNLGDKPSKHESLGISKHQCFQHKTISIKEQFRNLKINRIVAPGLYEKGLAESNP